MIAGQFTIAGTSLANNIAFWDGSNWSSFDSGMAGGIGDANVGALAVMNDGSLVAGGNFTTAGGVSASRIARWNGSSWTALGTGISNYTVAALVVMPNGDLIAGGSFGSAGGIPVSNIARWNGSTWSALGSGIDINGIVLAFKLLQDGSLITAGQFPTAGGITANSIARWNGTAWSALGSGIGGGFAEVDAVEAMPSGDLIAGGKFTNAGGVSALNIAKWNGTSWSSIGAVTPPSNFQGGVFALRTMPDGSVAVGGRFVNAGGLSAGSIARWNGTNWSTFGTGTTTAVNALSILPSGDLIASGGFARMGSAPALSIARWNGSSWSSLLPGFSNADGVVDVRTLVLDHGGDVLIGGEFKAVGSTPANSIIRMSPTTGEWSSLGTGMGGITPGTSVRAICVLPNNDIVAGGYFTTAGGIFVNNIARWNGGSWNALATGTGGTVRCLHVRPDGTMAVGGEFQQVGSEIVRYIAAWDGASWSGFGSGMTGGGNPYVLSAATMPNGDLVVGGSFYDLHQIARWDGTAWYQVGLGMGGISSPVPFAVNALVVMQNGDLVAGGHFETAGGVTASNIARWTGASWVPLGSGIHGDPASTTEVFALAVLSSGDMVAGGQFSSAGSVAANNIARWDGSSWFAMGAGTNAPVRALLALPDGDLLAGGRFTSAGSHVSDHIARWGRPSGCASPCDHIDFNGDGQFPSSLDITDFLSVFAGGRCDGQQPDVPPCNIDIDFNNDDLYPDTEDIKSLLSAFNGGPCV
ncbi:MAG TPA: hypothetical protein VHN77_07075 [Phycisphaerales bacterium]|nr:hypothetical protein [Phycisphaerales bacterium]